MKTNVGRGIAELAFTILTLLKTLVHTLPDFQQELICSRTKRIKVSSKPIAKVKFDLLLILLVIFWWNFRFDLDRCGAAFFYANLFGCFF